MRPECPAPSLDLAHFIKVTSIVLSMAQIFPRIRDFATDTSPFFSSLLVPGCDFSVDNKEQ